jgi:hypothetical protein
LENAVRHRWTWLMNTPARIPEASPAHPWLLQSAEERDLSKDSSLAYRPSIPTRSHNASGIGETLRSFLRIDEKLNDRRRRLAQHHLEMNVRCSGWTSVVDATGDPVS